MAEGRHDLEAKAAEAAPGVELDDLAVQDLDRLVEIGVEDSQRRGVAQHGDVDAGKIGMGRVHAARTIATALRYAPSPGGRSGPGFRPPKAARRCASRAPAPAGQSAPAPFRRRESAPARGCGRRSASDGASAGRVPAGGRGSAPGSNGRYLKRAPAPSG